MVLCWYASPRTQPQITCSIACGGRGTHCNIRPLKTTPRCTSARVNTHKHLRGVIGPGDVSNSCSVSQQPHFCWVVRDRILDPPRAVIDKRRRCISGNREQALNVLGSQNLSLCFHHLRDGGPFQRAAVIDTKKINSQVRNSRLRTCRGVVTQQVCIRCKLTDANAPPAIWRADVHVARVRSHGVGADRFRRICLQGCIIGKGTDRASGNVPPCRAVPDVALSSGSHIDRLAKAAASSWQARHNAERGNCHACCVLWVKRKHRPKACAAAAALHDNQAPMGRGTDTRAANNDATTACSAATAAWRCCVVKTPSINSCPQRQVVGQVDRSHSIVDVDLDRVARSNGPANR